MKSRSGSLRDREYWTLIILAGLALLLSVWIISLSGGNRTILSDVNARQQYINQSVQLSRLNTQLIQSLATVSAQTDDQELRRLLSAHGITYKTNKVSAERQ